MRGWWRTGRRSGYGLAKPMRSYIAARVGADAARALSAPRSLEMLPLVVADRNSIGSIEQDVARHQDRIREQTRGDEILLRSLLFELRHASKLAVARHSRQQPSRFGVRGHVTLHEHDRAVGIETGREQHRCHVVRARAQLRRVVLDRDRV